MTKNQMNRYLIFSTQRSGTHYLASLLQSSRAILCLGEVFHQRNSKNNFFSYLKAQPSVASPDLDEVRFSEYLEFEGAVRDRTRLAASHVGPILMYNQFDRLPERFRSGLLESRRIIHLYRSNFLRTHISNLINNLPGASSHGRIPQKKTTISVPPEDILQLLLKRRQIFEERRKMLSNVDHLELRYEELSDNPVHMAQGISEFLGVHEFRPSTTLVRSNPHPIKEIVENFSELEVALKGSDFEQLLNS